MSLTMIKRGDGKIVFDGKVTYFENKYKNITVDGETYTKRWADEVTKKVCELDNDRFFDREYYFEEIDVTEVIQDTHLFYNGLSPFTSTSGSTNEDVKCIVDAFNLGLLDKRILYLFTDNSTIHYDTIDYFILSKSEVPLQLFSYGFNNSVYYTISLEELLSIDLDKVEYRIKNWFIKKGVNLNKRDKVELALDIFKLKQDYETSKQQKRIGIYF